MALLRRDAQESAPWLRCLRPEAARLAPYMDRGAAARVSRLESMLPHRPLQEPGERIDKVLQRAA